MGELFEKIGRLIMELAHEVSEHRKTIHLLRRLKAGEVSLEDVVITGDSWALHVAPTLERLE